MPYEKRYKINFTSTEKSLLGLFTSIIESSLTGKTLAINDVIKWLLGFNQEMYIVLLYLLDSRKLLPRTQLLSFHSLCPKN